MPAAILPLFVRRNSAFVAVIALIAAFCTAVLAAPPAWAVTANPTPLAGARKNATRLPFSISGTASLSVDVGSGNGLFVDRLLTLPGVRSDVPISLSYNTSVWGTSTPSAVTNDTGSGWAITGFDQRLVVNADSSITYYGPGGLSGVFTSAGGGVFTAPSQFQADLRGPTSGTYTLTDHKTQEVLTFNSSTGRLTKDADRDANTTSYLYDGSGYPASIVSSRGATSQARTATITTVGGRITKISQSSGTLSRSVVLGYTAGNHLASITDAVNGVTSFDSGYSGPDNGQVVDIFNPQNTKTNLTFTSGKVSAVTQQNPPVDGGSGAETTRITYPTSTQTLVADPTTNQGQAVSAVPHTTYNLDSITSLRVLNATDPDGNQQSATYTPLADVASTTPAAGGTTTDNYGANSGESLTQIASPGGATETAGYTNTGKSTYLPSSSTDDASNALKYTFDSNGNQTGTQQNPSGMGPNAVVVYNSNGTAQTSASPGAAAGVVTSYTYDTGTGTLLTKITPPSGTSLGARNYTWDAFSRLSTATDGAGDTITYTYDNADRITKVQYSDTTPDVSYTYNALGQVTKRIDGSGTTTYSYDDLSHLLSTANTANTQSISYTYDLAGALATAVDGLGTVTYGYDAAHQLLSMTYPQSGSTRATWFANDANGRRTDAWLQSNSAHTGWSAHEHFGYDNSGRITSVLGENGPDSSPTTTVNETVCYAANSVAPACSTATANDRSNIQWTKDTVSGETNTYTYDTSNRLTKDVVTGGTNPRTYTFTYDSAGNRKTATVTGSSPSSQSLTFNNGNQISSTGYSYDGAGDLTTSPTRTASFNAAGQQTSATVGTTTSSYTYAGTNMNEILSATNQAGRTYTMSYGMPDRNGLPVIDSVQAGTGTGYVLHDPTGAPIMLATNGGQTCLYVTDAIGNPVVMSNSAQTTSLAERYDPYGAATRTDSGVGGSGAFTENPYLFGEGIQDRNTGEVKFGQRMYSPTTGSWTQQDALNAPLDPSNANRYGYAGDNPINQEDATGQCSVLDQLGLGTSLITGVLGFASGLLAASTFGVSIALVGLGGIFLSGVDCG